MESYGMGILKTFFIGIGKPVYPAEQRERRKALKMNYTIVRRSRKRSGELIPAVQRLIEDGWAPTGGIVLTDQEVAQAMVKGIGDKHG